MHSFFVCFIVFVSMVTLQTTLFKPGRLKMEDDFAHQGKDVFKRVKRHRQGFCFVSCLSQALAI